MLGRDLPITGLSQWEQLYMEPIFNLWFGPYRIHPFLSSLVWLTPRSFTKFWRIRNFVNTLCRRCRRPPSWTSRTATRRPGSGRSSQTSPPASTRKPFNNRLLFFKGLTRETRRMFGWSRVETKLPFSIFMRNLVCFGKTSRTSFLPTCSCSLSKHLHIRKKFWGNHETLSLFAKIIIIFSKKKIASCGVHLLLSCT